MKKIKTFFILLLILALQGCAGQKELNNLGIVTLMGIDLEEDNTYRITVHIVKPSTGQGGQPATSPGPGSSIFVGSSTGKTVHEAIKKLRKSTSWLLIWSHCDIFVLGERLCKEGIRDVIDFLARNAEIRLTSNVILGSPGAWKILQHPIEEKKEPVADQIQGLISNIVDWSMAYNLGMKDLLKRFLTGDKEIVLGRLKLEEADPVKKGQVAQSAGGGQGGGQQEQIKNILVLDGAAVFMGEKLAGYLSLEETRGYLRLMNELNKDNMNIMIPDGRLLALETYESSCTFQWEGEKDPLCFTVEIKENVRLVEEHGLLNYDDQQLIKTIEIEKARSVKEEIERVLKKAQVLQTDIFGLGAIIKREDPKLWEKFKNDWPERFSAISFKLDVKSKLSSSGMLIQSINQTE